MITAPSLQSPSVPACPLDPEEIQGACRRADSGATAVEYALLVALIAAVIVAIVTTLGLNVVNLYTTVKDAFPG